MTSRLARIVVGVAQVAASGILLALIVGMLDRAELRVRIISVSTFALLAGCGLLFVQQSIAAVRWRIIAAGLIAQRKPLSFILLWHGLGMTFGQLLPSTIGGDAIRIYALADSNQVARAVRSVLIDRVIGMFVLGLLVVISFALSPYVFLETSIMLSMLGIAAGGLAITLLLMRFSTKMTADHFLVRAASTVGSDLRIALAGRNGAIVVLQSFLIHFLSIGSFMILARSVGVADLDPIILGSIVCTALLASAIPLSIGGWGLREGFVAVASALIGIDVEAAVSASILFGSSLLIASMATAVAGGAMLIATRLARLVGIWKVGRS